MGEGRARGRAKGWGGDREGRGSGNGKDIQRAPSPHALPLRLDRGWGRDVSEVRGVSNG